MAGSRRSAGDSPRLTGRALHLVLVGLRNLIEPGSDSEASAVMATRIVTTRVLRSWCVSPDSLGRPLVAIQRAVPVDRRRCLGSVAGAGPSRRPYTQTSGFR